MKIIKILPHHLRHYFIIKFLDRDIEKEFNWYDNKKNKDNGESLIKAVIQKPSQLIQVVSNYDSICNMCPRNRRGKNYVQPKDFCTNYDKEGLGNELDTARMFGIESLIDKEPITSKELFAKLKTVYEKIFTEKIDPLSKKIPLREYFGVSPIELRFHNKINTLPYNFK